MSNGKIHIFRVSCTFHECRVGRMDQLRKGIRKDGKIIQFETKKASPAVNPSV